MATATATAPKTRKKLPMPPLDISEKRCGQIFSVDYYDIMNKAEEYARVNNIPRVSTDRFRIAIYDIDIQNCFCVKEDPRIGYKGSLYVQGAEKSTSNCARQVLENLDCITTWRRSRDFHTRCQIFHPMMFVAVADFYDPVFKHNYRKGDHPLPHTMMNHGDVVGPARKWAVYSGATSALQVKATGSAEYAPVDYMALEGHTDHYTSELDRKGKYKLYIWPYHALANDIDSAGVAVINEVEAFWGFARAGRELMDVKGGNPLTENYSVFNVEVNTTKGGAPIAQRNTIALDMLANHDVVIVRGQAKSHCWPWSIDDMLTDIMKQDPGLVKKVYLATDCTDPVIVPGVVDFTDDANKAVDRFLTAGMNEIKSTDNLRDVFPQLA